VGLNSILPGVGSLAGFSAVRVILASWSREADDTAMRLLANAGMTCGSPKLFAHLKEQLSEEKQSEPFFFGTHPALDESRRELPQAD